MLLKIVAFICGAVVMALELLGFRQLPPYFGSSIYVYGSLISTFLGALSLGYWLGGMLADRYPSLRLLGCLILLAGLYISVIPYIAEAVCPPLSRAIRDVRWGSLIASIILFFIPAALLGTVSPYIIKLSTLSLSRVGNIAGTLYALSTCGSIFGTLFTSFFLIAIWRIDAIILRLGVTLVATALALWIAAGRLKKSQVALPLLAVMLAGSGPLQAQTLGSKKQVLHRQETMYHRIVISQDSKWRYISFDRAIQSGMLLKDPYYSVFRYTEAFHLGLVFHPKAKQALFIGLGGATGPKQFRKFYPEMSLEVAELDPAVVTLSKRYFQWEEDKNLRVTVQDGRVFLQQTSKKYDLILLDAYYADSVPFHLATKEFFQVLKDRLTPEGVVIVNVIGSTQGNRSRFFRSEYKTLKEVYPEVLVFPVPESGETAANYKEFARRNIMIVCSPKARSLTREEIVEGATKLKNSRIPHLPLIAQAMLPKDKEPDTRHVPLLSDQYAPVESLIQVRLSLPGKILSENPKNFRNLF